MSRHRVSASARLNAPASVVYTVIADYREHHPHILPDAFSNMVVKQGGVGAGTIMSFDLRVPGRTRHYTGVVTEPKPGRYLVESYPPAGGETSFDVEPHGDGACTVTIATDFDVRSGWLGAIERWMSSALLRRLYKDELARLSDYVARVRLGDPPATARGRPG